MRANELRIGNAFKQPNDERIYFAMAITEDQIAYAKADFPDDYWYFDLDHIQPIPLTPEILEKCGFEKDRDSKIYPAPFTKFFWFEFDGDECVFKNADGEEVVLLYVHQLQNLYFALTNEELEVNLTPATANH